MEFDLTASSPVLEIQSSDFALNRIHDKQVTNENGSSATHAGEEKDDVIDLTTPKVPAVKSNVSAPASAELPLTNGHAANGPPKTPPASHGINNNLPVVNPAVQPEAKQVLKQEVKQEVKQEAKPESSASVPSALPASAAERQDGANLQSPRPLKRQKVEPKTPETPIVTKQESVTKSAAAAPTSGIARKASSQRVLEVKEETIKKPLEVPPHSYSGAIEGDTDEEDTGLVEGPRLLETKSALCQFKTRRKQGLAYKIYKHEVYARLHLLVIESRYWTEYVGVFDSAEQATTIGETLVRQISGRVSNDNKPPEPAKPKGSKPKDVKDPRVEAHEQAKARLRTTKFPVEVNNYFKLVATGTLVTSGPGHKNFHNSNYVFPVGFKSIRNYFCCKDPTKKVNYTNEILRGESGPLFKVTREESDLSFEGTSASAAWNKLCKRIAERKKELGMFVSQPGKDNMYCVTLCC